MHEVLVNRLGGLSLPRKSVVRLTDRLNMTLDVYRGRKTTNLQYCLPVNLIWSWRFCVYLPYSNVGFFGLESQYSFVLLYLFGYKMEFFSFQNNPKDLDLSCKTDLDLWDCLGRVKLVL